MTRPKTWASSSSTRVATTPAISRPTSRSTTSPRRQAMPQGTRPASRARVATSQTFTVPPAWYRRRAEHARRDDSVRARHELVDQHRAVLALDADHVRVGGDRHGRGDQRLARVGEGLVLRRDREGHGTEGAGGRLPAHELAPQHDREQPRLDQHLPGQQPEAAQPARLQPEADQVLRVDQLLGGGPDGRGGEPEQHLVASSVLTNASHSPTSGMYQAIQNFRRRAMTRCGRAAGRPGPWSQARYPQLGTWRQAPPEVPGTVAAGTGPSSRSAAISSGRWASRSMKAATVPEGRPASRRRTATISRWAVGASARSIRRSEPRASSAPTALWGTRAMPRPR